MTALPATVPVTHGNAALQTDSAVMAAMPGPRIRWLLRNLSCPGPVRIPNLLAPVFVNPALEPTMKSRRPDPAVIVETVVQALLSEGAELRSVTLDEFKQRMTYTIRSLCAGTKASAA